MYGCHPHWIVTRKVEIPTAATSSRTTRWVRDRVDAHGNLIEGEYLTEPEILVKSVAYDLYGE